MKKLILSALFLFSLASFALAGEQSLGGKTCTNGQTSCLMGDQGLPGKTGETNTDNLTGSGDILSFIKGYLGGIFG